MEFTDMKDRIAHIIRAKNLTAADFALRLGIQPSNVSHLLAGRNNPSLEFVKKLKETFPEYNLDWIVFGKGPMTLSDPFPVSTAENAPLHEPESVEQMPHVNLLNETEQPAPFSGLPLQTYRSDLQQIILVYADHSFEILSPR